MALYLIDKAQINNKAASIARTLDRIFLDGQQFKAWLDAQSDDSLINAYGYVSEDLNILRAAIADIEQLRLVYQGTVQPNTKQDFRAFTKQTYPFGSI